MVVVGAILLSDGRLELKQDNAGITATDTNTTKHTAQYDRRVHNSSPAIPKSVNIWKPNVLIQAMNDEGVRRQLCKSFPTSHTSPSCSLIIYLFFFVIFVTFGFAAL